MPANIFSIAYLVTNLSSIFILVAAIKWPGLARFLLSSLFFVAALYNVDTIMRAPQSYLVLGGLAVFPVYEDFIFGAFKNNITTFVLSIAFLQLFTSFAIAARGELMKVGLTIAIVFLLAIAPLGAGAAFPSSVILAIAAVILLFKAKRLSIHHVLYPVRHLLN
ncbi:hypothetical protein [Chitinophaga vietnamensis]|uniref:hypothetical protein n=1 Tax=Chitinophaga vietnamensis TaxID=2593957 RepID=UPI00117878EF|nr:hypothetical protein [Chitinophaga vietnamensis]